MKAHWQEAAGFYEGAPVEPPAGNGGRGGVGHPLLQVDAHDKATSGVVLKDFF